jgi:5-methyltetrahydrofolate--homocysteine methyltransferase
MCGQAQLYQWMYQEPTMVHDLFDLVAEAFIQWVKVQKVHIGEPLQSSNGLQGAHSPFCGVWESDDDMVLIAPDLYAEFVLPAVSRIFTAFGGGSIHFCGAALQHLDNLRQVENLKVINNSPLGNYAAFGQLRRILGEKVVFQIQDGAPADPETYYATLFAEVEDFRGLMLATFVMDNVGMDAQGGYIPMNWQPIEAANRLANSVRQAVSRRLAGEDTRPLATNAKTIPAVKPQEPPQTAHPAYLPEQERALEAVRQALLDFDQDALSQAIQSALQTGLRPFDVILGGMAEAMSAVGRLYEAGEFFLPELVMAGATMQAGMEILKPYLHEQGGEGALLKGKVILGTVKGDLHDIGKNLVRTMLEGAQFEVIDLGVDVPPAKFVEAVQTHASHVVALSALLTTTLPAMRQTMQALETAGLRPGVKVIVGGAPISREFAEQIGAEGYAASAVGAVAEVERLLGLG